MLDGDPRHLSHGIKPPSEDLPDCRPTNNASITPLHNSAELCSWVLRWGCPFLFTCQHEPVVNTPGDDTVCHKNLQSLGSKWFTRKKPSRRMINIDNGHSRALLNRFGSAATYNATSRDFYWDNVKWCGRGYFFDKQ